MTSTTRDSLVRRPFEGIPNEQDLVAMRQLIPAATMEAKATSDYDGVRVVLASVLPMAWPAIHRTDGAIMLGLQSTLPGNDISRALGAAFVQATKQKAGSPVETITLAEDSPRLQDVLDLSGDFRIEVQETFDFWIDPGAERTPQVEASLEHANDSILPTKAVEGLPHAYWVDAGAKEHLRWVLDADEDKVIDAVARLHAKRESALDEGTKYVGSFRAEGMAIPVWDLPKGFGVEGVEKIAADYQKKFMAALETDEPLTVMERRARGGIVARQVTLR